MAGTGDQKAARPIPMDRLWADQRTSARHRRSGAGGRCRRLRRPARPAAASCAQPEGRPVPHLDPGARRAVSRLHRAGAGAAARTRRRLSGHGGVARLPEVEAADPEAGRRRRRERRGTGGRAAVPAEAAGSHARCRRPAGQPQPARPRCLRARHAGTGHRREAQRVFGQRSTICSPPMPSSASARRSPMCASPSAASGRSRRRARSSPA